MIRPVSRQISVALLASVAAATAPSIVNAAPFTFARAEYLPSALGMARAEDFLAHALPPGLPMTEAIRRLRRADMACGSADRGQVVCEFSEDVRPEGGDDGADIWTVRLTAGDGGALQSAVVTRSHIGMPGLIAE